MKIYSNICFIVTSLITLTGCNDSGTEISADKFCELLSLPMGTMTFSKYIGSNDEKAFIELHEMSSLSAKTWSVNKYWSNKKAVSQKCVIPNN
jgi:hypothetical protein